MRRPNVAFIGSALVIGAVTLLVGGAWAIVILEAGVALLVAVAVLIYNLKRGGDGDAAG